MSPDDLLDMFDEPEWTGRDSFAPSGQYCVLGWVIRQPLSPLSRWQRFKLWVRRYVKS